MRSISFHRKNKSKLGVSLMIGYVLLVTFAIVIGAVVYTWMKSYVPAEKPECPDGASLFIKEIPCNGTNLTIIVENNGRFDLAGYFIRGAENKSQEIATIDLTPYTPGVGDMIKFNGEGDNSLAPTREDKRIFDLSAVSISFVEIIPIRYDYINSKKTMEVCNNIKIKEEISCPEA